MKRDIACKHINLHRLLSLRGENFRWADLVSGNLKEEKNAHSTSLLHLSGPQHQPRNLLFRYVTKQICGAPSLGFRRVFLGESKHKRQPFKRMTVTTGAAAGCCCW